MSPINYDAGRKIFLLQIASCRYALGVGATGRLVNLHWCDPGKRVEDLPFIYFKEQK